MDDSPELLRAYAETGSEAAFRQVVELHLPLVYSTALRRVGGDSHLAEDIVQTVFTDLALWTRPPGKLRTEDIRCLAAWLHHHTCLKSAETIRSERRRALRETTVAMDSPSTVDPSPEWRELAPVLDEALSELPPEDRQAILLRFFEQRDWRSVGQSLGLGNDAAQKRVSRALEKLRTKLLRRGIASSTAALAALLAAHAVSAAPVGLAVATAGVALGTAAAGAVSAAAPVGLLAETLALIMTAKKWTALAALVLVGAAVLPLLKRTGTPEPPDIQVQFAVQSPAPITPKAPAGAPFQWAAIESRDYRQFIANLRASGAPERLISDVVGLELYRDVAPKIRSIRGALSKTPYWQKPPKEALSKEQEGSSIKILGELRTVLVSLLGSGARDQDTLNLLFCQTDDMESKLAWLPPETEERAKAVVISLMADATLKENSYSGQQLGLAQELKALQPVLTPAQLEEYRLRNEREAEGLRGRLMLWNPSETEFKALLQADRRKLSSSSMIWSRAEQEKVTMAVSDLLGPERAASYIQATDITYMNAEDVAGRLGLPADTATRIYQIKQQALLRDDTLRTNRQLDPASALQQRAEIRQWAEEQVAALVGPSGLCALQQSDWPWWQQLKKP